MVFSSARKELFFKSTETIPKQEQPGIQMRIKTTFNFREMVTCQSWTEQRLWGFQNKEMTCDVQNDVVKLLKWN